MTARNRNTSKPQPAVQLAPRDQRSQRGTPLREGGEGSPRSGGSEVSRGRRSAAPKVPARRGSIELTRLLHVRAEVARLYIHYLAAWGPNPKASQARVLCTLLGQIRTLLVDVELVERMRKIEDEHAHLRAQLAPGGIGPGSAAPSVN